MALSFPQWTRQRLREGSHDLPNFVMVEGLGNVGLKGLFMTRGWID